MWAAKYSGRFVVRLQRHGAYGPAAFHAPRDVYDFAVEQALASRDFFHLMGHVSKYVSQYTSTARTSASTKLDFVCLAIQIDRPIYHAADRVRWQQYCLTTSPVNDIAIPV